MAASLFGKGAFSGRAESRHSGKVTETDVADLAVVTHIEKYTESLSMGSDCSPSPVVK